MPRENLDCELFSNINTLKWSDNELKIEKSNTNLANSGEEMYPSFVKKSLKVSNTDVKVNFTMNSTCSH